MKILVNTKELKEAIAITKNAMVKKPALEVLECVKLMTDDNELIVEQNTLDNIYQVRMDCNSVEQGFAIIKFKELESLLKSVKADTIEIETEGNICKITSGSTLFKIVNKSYDEFPLIPDLKFDTGKDIALKQKTLKDMLKRVLFAVGDDDSRPVLQAVNFVTEGDRLEMVAIDGYRMAIAKTSKLMKDVVAQQILIKGSDLEKVQKLLTVSEDPVTIWVSPKYARITFDSKGKEVAVLSRLIEGDYMKYKDIIPTSPIVQIETSLSEIKGCFEIGNSINPTAKKEKRIITLVAEGDKLEFSASTESGTSSEYIYVNRSGNSDAIDMNFNADYVRDIFDAVDCDRIRVSFNGALSPVIVETDKLLKTYTDGELYLILPLRK